MPSFMPPPCYSCKHFKSNPKFIGDSGHCSKFATIPKEIFYQSGNCPHYASKTAKSSARGKKKK